MLCHLGEDMKLKTLPVIPVRDLSIYESLPLKIKISGVSKSMLKKTIWLLIK